MRHMCARARVGAKAFPRASTRLCTCATRRSSARGAGSQAAKGHHMRAPGSVDCPRRRLEELGVVELRAAVLGAWSRVLPRGCVTQTSTQIWIALRGGGGCTNTWTRDRVALVGWPGHRQQQLRGHRAQQPRQLPVPRPSPRSQQCASCRPAHLSLGHTPMLCSNVAGALSWDGRCQKHCQQRRLSLSLPSAREQSMLAWSAHQDTQRFTNLCTRQHVAGVGSGHERRRRGDEGFPG